MKPFYRFVICRHVLDGFHAALQSPIPSGKQSWILLARGGTSVATALGYSIPWDYNGIATLLGFTWEEAAVSVSSEGRSAAVVLPAAQNVTAQGATLERLRSCHPQDSFVQVVLTYEHALDDLPYLESGDQVTLLWELRETLTTLDSQRLITVGEKLMGTQTQRPGIEFYLRQSPLEEDLIRRKSEIENSLHQPHVRECLHL